MLSLSNKVSIPYTKVLIFAICSKLELFSLKKKVLCYQQYS